MRKCSRAIIILLFRFDLLGSFVRSPLTSYSFRFDNSLEGHEGGDPNDQSVSEYEESETEYEDAEDDLEEADLEREQSETEYMDADYDLEATEPEFEPTETEYEDARYDLEVESGAESELGAVMEAEVGQTLAESLHSNLAYLAVKASSVFKNDDEVPNFDASIDRAAAMATSQESSRNFAGAAALRAT